MILSEIKQYVQHHNSASLQHLALHFRSEPEAMRGMLEHWIRKGNIRKHLVAGGCQGCSKCDSGQMEMYEWIA